MCPQCVFRVLGDERSAAKIVMSGLSANVNRYILRIRVCKSPQEVTKHKRETDKVNVLRVLSIRKLFWSVFFAESTVTGIV